MTKQTYKMLALVTDAWGGRGGIAQYNRDFLTALAESGQFSSITVLPRLAPDPVSPPSAIQQLTARTGRFGYSVAALRRALFARVDVVFCGHVYLAPVAALIAWMKGAKLIVQTHGVEAWPRPSRLQRFAVERADFVLSVSRYTRASVLNWAAITPERAVVVPDTVREMFTPGNGRARCAELGIEGKRVLLTVGRMVASERYKGHERVMAAIPDLVKQGHDICYLVVGEGNDRSRLEALAAEIDVCDRVKFLGTLDSPTLLETYRAADLFVMPSTGEGFGVSFLEAMASGTPALGLNVGGAQDALGDGELGAVVPENELVMAMKELLTESRCDGAGLSAAVRVRFGSQKMKNAAQLVCDRLMEIA